MINECVSDSPKAVPCESVNQNTTFYYLTGNLFKIDWVFFFLGKIKDDENIHP